MRARRVDDNACLCVYARCGLGIDDGRWSACACARAPLSSSARVALKLSVCACATCVHSVKSTTTRRVPVSACAVSSRLINQSRNASSACVREGHRRACRRLLCVCVGACCHCPSVVVVRVYASIIKYHPQARDTDHFRDLRAAAALQLPVRFLDSHRTQLHLTAIKHSEGREDRRLTSSSSFHIIQVISCLRHYDYMTLRHEGTQAYIARRWVTVS